MTFHKVIAKSLYSNSDLDLWPYSKLYMVSFQDLSVFKVWWNPITANIRFCKGTTESVYSSVCLVLWPLAFKINTLSGFENTYQRVKYMKFYQSKLKLLNKKLLQTHMPNNPLLLKRFYKLTNNTCCIIFRGHKFLTVIVTNEARSNK